MPFETIEWRQDDSRKPSRSVRIRLGRKMPAESVVRGPDSKKIRPIMHFQWYGYQQTPVDFSALSVEKIGYLFTKV
jgi:hypothetical protein